MTKLAASLVPFLSPGSPALANPALLDSIPKCDGFGGYLTVQCEAHARHPSAGPTARWVTPDVLSPTRAVVCPTCGRPVMLAEWWSHPCRQVRPRAKPAPAPRPKRSYWNGDIPHKCNVCDALIRNGFGDGPLPGRSTWGIYCGLCWNLNGPELGQYYERTRSGRFVKMESRP